MGVNVIEEMALIIKVTDLYEYVLGAEPLLLSSDGELTDSWF